MSRLAKQIASIEVNLNKRDLLEYASLKDLSLTDAKHQFRVYDDNASHILERLESVVNNTPMPEHLKSVKRD